MVRRGTALVKTNNPLSNIKSTDLIPHLSNSVDILPVPPNLQPTYIPRGMLRLVTASGETDNLSSNIKSTDLR